MPIGPSDTVTNNYGFVLPAIGADVGTWGGIINTYLTSQLDAILGNVVPITLTNANVALTLAQWQSGGVFVLTGLTGNVTISLPLSPNASGGAPAVAGRFIVSNQTNGVFTVTVNTVVAGSTGVVVPQGQSSLLYSDGTNVQFADNTRAAKFAALAGNPIGNITGNAGNPATGQPADAWWDTTDQRLYISLGGTNWANVGPSLPMPGGYLTPASGSPGAAAESGVSNIFYTAFRGNQIPIFNGTSFSIYAFSGDLTVAIGGMAANTAYDIFAFFAFNSLQMGYGPQWGSTSARSLGLQRVNGILVNSALATLTAPALPGGAFSVAVSQATYLGTVYADAGGGTVTNNRAVKGGGAPAKWGIWNNYHRLPIALLVSDPTASWPYGGTWRQSNGNPNNAAIAFTGMPEEVISVDFDQVVSVNNPMSFPSSQIGLGLNQTAVPGGPYGVFGLTTASGGAATLTQSLHSKLVVNAPLGLSTIYPIEQYNGNVAGTNAGLYNGGLNHMLLAALYHG